MQALHCRVELLAVDDDDQLILDERDRNRRAHPGRGRVLVRALEDAPVRLAPAVRESLLSMMKEEDLPRNVYYGDGSPIEDSVVDYLRELSQKLCVSFPWQEQDILMLNNMLVAHSRNPFVGERKIVVAMGDLVSKEQVEQFANN